MVSSEQNVFEVVIVGDVIANATYARMHIVFDDNVSGLVRLPLILNASSVAPLEAYSDGLNYTVVYDDENNVFEVLVPDSVDELYVEAFLAGVFIEEGFNVYSLEIDLSLEGFDKVSCETDLVGDYAVMILSDGGYSIRKIGNETKIILYDATRYSLVFYPSTDLIVPVTSSPGSSTSTTALTSYFTKIALILAVTMIPIVYAIHKFVRKKHTRLYIETIPSRDILSDNVVRDIIVVVGDAGEEGVPQSRVVSILGKPKSTISRKIRRLSEEGYIEIIRKGKINVLKLTDKGKEVYNRILRENK